MTRILLMLLCLRYTEHHQWMLIQSLSISLHPIGGRGDQPETIRRRSRTTVRGQDRNQDTTVISLDQVSIIMVIRRGRIGLVESHWPQGRVTQRC